MCKKLLPDDIIVSYSMSDIMLLELSTINDLASITTIIGFIATLGAALIYQFWKAVSRAIKMVRLDQNFLHDVSKKDLLSIKSSYVEQDCDANIDPNTLHDFDIENRKKTEDQFIISARPIQEALLRFIRADPKRPNAKVLMVLADSGMGKTTAALMLTYRSHVSGRYRLSNLPKFIYCTLGSPDVEEFIESINTETRKKSGIILDAFDEDHSPKIAPVDRLFTLISKCKDFKKIIITCRSQFFEAESAIPKRVDKIDFGHKSLSLTQETEIPRIYILPFDRQKIDDFIKRKYGIWKPKKKRSAYRLIYRIRKLSARPMILSYIDDLITMRNMEIHTVSHIYQTIINAWLKREETKKAHINAEELDKAMSYAAQIIFENSNRGSGELLHMSDIERIQNETSVNLTELEISARSLLVRDSDYSFKFAHRSFLEFYLAKYWITSFFKLCNTWMKASTNRYSELHPFSLQTYEFIRELLNEYHHVNINGDLAYCRIGAVKKVNIFAVLPNRMVFLPRNPSEQPAPPIKSSGGFIPNLDVNTIFHFAKLGSINFLKKPYSDYFTDAYYLDAYQYDMENTLTGIGSSNAEIIQEKTEPIILKGSEIIILKTINSFHRLITRSSINHDDIPSFTFRERDHKARLIAPAFHIKNQDEGSPPLVPAYLTKKIRTDIFPKLEQSDGNFDMEIYDAISMRVRESLITKMSNTVSEKEYVNLYVMDHLFSMELVVPKSILERPKDSPLVVLLMKIRGTEYALVLKDNTLWSNIVKRYFQDYTYTYL